MKSEISFRECAFSWLITRQERRLSLKVIIRFSNEVNIMAVQEVRMVFKVCGDFVQKTFIITITNNILFTRVIDIAVGASGCHNNGVLVAFKGVNSITGVVLGLIVGTVTVLVLLGLFKSL